MRSIPPLDGMPCLIKFPTMNLRSRLLPLFACLVALLPGKMLAQDDPGKANIGRISVGVIYATDGDPAQAGEKFKKVSDRIEKQLRSEQRLTFKNYRLLGREVQPLFRSYENWSQPLKPSDEVLVRFEARTLPTAKSTPLDVELWLSRKKILKTDINLVGEKPLFVLGPQWRGGRLIISIALAPKENPDS